MKIRVGYDIAFRVPQSTSMILMLSLHPSRAKDLLTSQRMATEPNLPLREYRDIFGNVCTRVLAPAGTVRFSSTFEILDSGRPDEVVANARQHPIDELPDDALIYLLGSRYCDTQKLSDFAWRTFANSKPGWDRVQAICNFVHDHIKFDYAFARDYRTAFDAFHEKVGVCRDFTHLAVALCRCMNIPARYCTGYLGDIGVPPDPAPMDFSAWFEVFLEGHWFTRAVSSAGMDGFSRWGTLGYVFSILQILFCAEKRCPQGLKPGSSQRIYGTGEPVPFQGPTSHTRSKAQHIFNYVRPD